jgi:hypothetical protein
MHEIILLGKWLFQTTKCKIWFTKEMLTELRENGFQELNNFYIEMR